MARLPSIIADLGPDEDRHQEEATRGELPAEYPEGDDLPPERYALYTRALWDEQEGPLDPLHRTWIQNLLFLLSYQWWKYDPITGIAVPETVPKYRERPVANLLVPYFKHLMAKLTKQRPAFRCIPATTDPDDIHAANLGDDVLRAKWQELRISRVIRRAVAWVATTGNAYFYPFWRTDTGKLRPLTVPVEAAKIDEETGEVVGVTIVECPCNEDGEPIMKEGPGGGMIYDLEVQPAYVDEGDVGVKVISPFQVRVDPGAETEEDVTFVIIGEVLPIRDIRRRWPDLEHVIPEDLGLMERYDALVTGLGIHTLRAGPDTHLASGAANRTENIPKALVLHYHEKPSPKYPGGRYWVVVGNELAEKPQPLPEGIWPVIHHLKEIEVPGRYHAASTFESAVGLQREYNEVNALIKEYHNLMLRGKWLVPIGSNIRRGQITQQPGEVIQYTPGLKPEMVTLKPLPQAVYAERERILHDFEQITGIRKVSMGEAPPGVTSGRAFLTLQEADDTDLAPLIESLEECVADLAWSFIQIIRNRYDDERLVHVVGADRRYQVRAFKGSDLSGVVDVVPQQGSAFPWSQVARQNMLIEIAQAMPALFEDPETGGFDRHKFAQLLPVAGLDSLFAHEDIDYNEAKREEEQFELYDGTSPGSLPRVLPWQNHAVHLRIHEYTLKTEGFKQWHPLAQEAFINHWRETRAEFERQITAALARQAMAAGAVAPAPAGGNGGSPPGGQ